MKKELAEKLVLEVVEEQKKIVQHKKIKGFTPNIEAVDNVLKRHHLDDKANLNFWQIMRLLPGIRKDDDQSSRIPENALEPKPRPLYYRTGMYA